MNTGSDGGRATTRRNVLAAGGSLVSMLLVRPARATPEAMTAAIQAFVGGSSARKGRVTLDIPALVENGNSVPLKVTVESPMAPDDFVKTISIFNERNPQPNVANFHLPPRSAEQRSRPASAWATRRRSWLSHTSATARSGRIRRSLS